MNYQIFSIQSYKDVTYANSFKESESGQEPMFDIKQTKLGDARPEKGGNSYKIVNKQEKVFLKRKNYGTY